MYIRFTGVPPKLLLMHYVYVLLSIVDHKLYTGYTNDLKQRLEKHNAGKVRATHHRKPLKIIYYEAYLDEYDARTREHFFKSGWGRNYIQKNLKGTLKKVKV